MKGFFTKINYYVNLCKVKSTHFNEENPLKSGAIVDDQGKMNNFAIEPQMYVMEESQAGFTRYSENLNGRAAMIGFISLLALEALTGQGIIGFLTSL